MDNTVVTINPANEQVISEYENMTNEQVTNIVSKSRSAFSEWRRDVQKDLSYCFNWPNSCAKIRSVLRELHLKRWENQ